MEWLVGFCGPAEIPGRPAVCSAIEAQHRIFEFDLRQRSIAEDEGKQPRFDGEALDCQIGPFHARRPRPIWIADDHAVRLGAWA